MDSASVSISCHRNQTPIVYRTLPTTLSLRLRMQRYDNFLNPPNFRRSFFFELLARASYTYYIQGRQAMLLTSKTCSPLMRLRHFRNPVLLSCECKGTTTFPIHQMFGEFFFGGGHNEPTQYADAQGFVCVAERVTDENGHHLAVIQRTPSCFDTMDAIPLDTSRVALHIATRPSCAFQRARYSSIR